MIGGTPPFVLREDLTVKLLLVDEDGTLLDTIEDVDSYNLDKSMGRAALADEVVEAVQKAAQR